MKAASARRRDKLSALLAAQGAVPQSGGGASEIAELRLFPVREPVSRRSYCIVRVKTRSGAAGFGECAQAEAADLRQAEQRWIGRQATSYATSDLPSPLSAAIDMALLDIVGKMCRAPIYRVLGGPTRHKVRALASLAGTTDAELLASFDRAAAAGFRAFTVPVPPTGARNQGRAYQLAIRGRLQRLREKGGEGMDFVLAANGQLTSGDAASVATTIEPLHPLWFDEPCASTLQGIRKISAESVAPLGFGKSIIRPIDYQELLRAGFIDVVRPDIGREGITWCRRIASLAETYYVAVAPRHEGGPLATAAALHLAASLPNFFVQHIPLPAAAEDRGMRAEIAGGGLETVRDGFAALPSAPGLGANVSESALEKYHAA
jgi:galactonate dehydratase